MTPRAILFDWRGTLFYDEPDADWVRASAASIGQVLSDDQLAGLVARLGAAADHPDVVATREHADCSADLHRAAGLLELGLAGFEPQLAGAIHDRDGDLSATQPYPDAEPILRAVKAAGLLVAIVSDIHYPLRAHFEHYGLADLVDVYALSFEHGVQKPAPELFEIALARLGVKARDALMVGDRPTRDGGAVTAGIATLILPPVPPGERRGLDVLLRFLHENASPT